jgi:SAM-dependent methyltransferase
MGSIGVLAAGVLGRPGRGMAPWLLAPLWNRRNSDLNDAALSALELRPQDRVLEVGFGGGYLLGRIASAVTEGLAAGVDPCRALVDRGLRRFRSRVAAGRVDLRCAPAEELPFPSGSFGKACTVNSLFFWKQPERGLGELHRVLDDRGRLVVCLTVKRCLENRWFLREGVRLLENGEIVEMVERAGFAIIDSRLREDAHREFILLTAGKRAMGEGGGE